MSAFVPRDGGTVSLPGYASLVFVEGTFPAGDTVTVTALAGRIPPPSFARLPRYFRPVLASHTKFA
jgi:hypothetical protein